jgi:hypothetical protein
MESERLSISAKILLITSHTIIDNPRYHSQPYFESRQYRNLNPRTIDKLHTRVFILKYTYTYILTRKGICSLMISSTHKNHSSSITTTVFTPHHKQLPNAQNPPSNPHHSRIRNININLRPLPDLQVSRVLRHVVSDGLIEHVDIVATALVG